MTTILGIKADYPTSGIVLFSDTQAALRDGKFQFPDQKILKPSPYYALASTGKCIRSREFREFLGNGSKRSAEMLRGYLEDRHIPDYSEHFDDVYLLIGLRLDDLALYYVDNKGIVTKVRKYMADGSGGELAKGVLRKRLNGRVSLEKAIEVGYTSVRTAFQDIYTGGSVSFAVITEEGIDMTGTTLARKVMRMEREAIKEARARYRG